MRVEAVRREGREAGTEFFQARDLDGFHVLVSLEEPLDHLLVLFGSEGAGGVQDVSASSKAVVGVAHDPSLSADVHVDHVWRKRTEGFVAFCNQGLTRAWRITND